LRSVFYLDGIWIFTKKKNLKNWNNWPTQMSNNRKCTIITFFNFQYIWEGISMKNLFLFITLAIIIISGIYCSDNQNFQGRMNPEARAAKLKETLDLTDEQSKQVEQIYQESVEKMSEMRDQFEGDRSQMREHMMKDREEINKKIEDILYEDQKVLYREYQEERQSSRRERREQGQRQE
jgi:hypothetical protein